MAYDLHGAWNVSVGLGHNAPLYASSTDITAEQKQLNVKASVDFWINQGLVQPIFFYLWNSLLKFLGTPREKIILGIPLYGRTFTLRDSNKIAIGSAQTGAGISGKYSNEPGMIGYNEVN